MRRRYSIHKRYKNRFKKTFSLLLCLALCAGTEAPVYAQEEFTSGDADVTLYQDREDEKAAEFQDTSVNEEETQTDGFESGESTDIFGTGDEVSQGDGDIRYIKGRPLTKEEREEQLEPFKYLTPMEQLPPIGSDLSIATYEMYPSKYDAREEGFVTSVKNQYQSPMCYAFSLNAAAETSLLSQGKGIYDLSEAHLAYFFGNRSNDPLGNTPNDKNVVYDQYAWYGQSNLAAVFLTTWSGLTTEDDVPLPSGLKYSGNSAEKIPPEKEYHACAYIKESVFSDYSMSRMKELIMQFQAVEFGLKLDTNYYNSDTAAACNPDKVNANHSVVAIGWDDNYSAKNFAASSHVTKDGAWIVKNSWGDKWGDDGYFYLSYEDKNICDLMTVSVTDNPEFTNNYLYDGSTGLSRWSLAPGQSMAVAFEAKAGNGKVEALGEVNVITFSDNASYSIQIYTNLTDISNPCSGSEVYEVPYEVYQPMAGIKTVKIPEVVLQQGSRYSVVLTNTGDNHFSIGREVSNSGSWYRTETGSNIGESFFRASENGNWRDLHDLSASPRIKAHTRTLDTSITPVLSFTADKTVLKSGESVKARATVTPDSLNYIKLIYESSNPNVASVDAGGIIKGKKNGTAVITCKSADSSQLLSTVTVKVKAFQVPELRAESKSYNRIDLSWERLEDAKGYVIYRAEEGKKSKKLAETGAGTAKYKDTSVKTGKTYTYTVTPFKTKSGKRVYGKKSDKAVAKCTLNTPEFTVKALTGGYNQIKWKKVPGAEAYNIFHKKPEEEKWKFLRTATPSETKYNDKALTPGTAYQYLIQAYREVDGSKVYSRYNVSPAIKVAPAITKIISAENKTDGIYIRWNTQKSCDGYQILRKTENSSWKQIAKINDKNENSWIDESVEAGKVYYYAVRAFVRQTEGNTYGKYKSSSAIKR